MTDKIYDTTKMKQELNCGYLITPVLRYYIHLFGKEKSAEYIESLGVSVKFLENKNNWVSYNYYLSLLEKLVEVTGDSNAPFLTAFTTNPQAYFEEFYFMTYATIASKSPKFGFKLAFSKKIYSRYTKIGDFEVTEENKNSMTIKLVLKEGYVQNALNCLAIQGFMAAFPIAWGNKPAKVRHEECITKGDSACIFKIEWETEKSRFNLIFLGTFSFFSILSVVLKSYNIISFKDIIIFFLIFLITYITSRSVVSSRKRKEEMGFNYKKNKYIFDAMEKIEKDYNEILSMKIELERRNKFLSIINEVNEKILKINDFSTLLLNVADILIKNFDFEKAAFFRLSKEEDKYESDFEIGNSKNILDEEKKRKIQIALGDYDKIKNSNYFMDYNIVKNLNSVDFIRWIKEGNCICSIPIETLDANGGFYLFVFNDKSMLNNRLIENLFENVANQLKIGYEKITSISIIENILSTMPSGVTIFEKDKFLIRYYNKIFSGFFDFSDAKSSFYGENIFDILPFEIPAKEFIFNVINNRESLNEDKSFQAAFFNRIFECRIFCLNDSKNENLYGLVLNDITETVNFEQKIILNEKLLALGKAASGIAHEINNPLYVVLANAEEISEAENIPQNIKEYAEEIVELIVNVSGIIKDLSSYSKNLRNEKIDEVNIHTIIEEAFKIVKYSHNFSNVEIVKNFGIIPRINATKGEIEQIFINLFNNSLYAMNAKGKIEISTELSDNKIKISVSDTGGGIPEDTIPYIFDLFYTTKKNGEGSGQGLHIVRKIVSKYNGFIDLKSEVGKGTTFYITFNV